MMTLNELIDLALQDVPPKTLYEAVDNFGREHQQPSGQFLGTSPTETTRIWAVLDVLRRPMLPFSDPGLTPDERSILTGLRTQDSDQAGGTDAPQRNNTIDRATMLRTALAGVLGDTSPVLTTIARKAASFLTMLEDTPPVRLEQTCRQTYLIRDPAALAAIQTHRTALIAELKACGVKRFS